MRRERAKIVIRLPVWKCFLAAAFVKHCHWLLKNVNVDLVAAHEQEQVEPTALYELHAVLGLLHIEGGTLKVSKPLLSLVMSKVCERVESMQNLNITIAQTQNMVSTRFCQAANLAIRSKATKSLLCQLSYWIHLDFLF